MTTLVFDTVAYPDLAHVHDRSGDRPAIDRVYFGEGDFSQGADINEAFSIEERKRSAIGDLIAKDGDRLSGGDIVVDVATSTVRISAGSLYARGSSCGLRSPRIHVLRTSVMIDHHTVNHRHILPGRVDPAANSNPMER